MRIGEVSLNTNDVVRLANFYKALLGIDNGSNDAVSFLSEWQRGDGVFLFQERGEMR